LEIQVEKSTKGKKAKSYFHSKFQNSNMEKYKPLSPSNNNKNAVSLSVLMGAPKLQTHFLGKYLDSFCIPPAYAHVITPPTQVSNFIFVFLSFLEKRSFSNLFIETNYKPHY
jgi:hypothetical protein